VISIARAGSPTEEVRTLVGELEAVLAASYPPEQRHGLSLEAIFQPHIHFFIARVDDAPVGCGGVALFADFAEVKRMYVREAARGQGVADAILDRLAATARTAGHSVLCLETDFGDYASLRSHAIATRVYFQKRL
jgi:putative acetyltransferase